MARADEACGPIWGELSLLCGMVDTNFFQHFPGKKSKSAVVFPVIVIFSFWPMSVCTDLDSLFLCIKLLCIKIINISTKRRLTAVKVSCHDPLTTDCYEKDND